jgi:type IV pilus assembly protein PilM
MENTEIVTREIVLPTTDETSMQNMLRFEVQQYMPIELDNYIIQFKALDTFEEKGDKKTRFLSTAVPKALAQSYFDLFQKICLKAAVLDIHSNSIEKLAWSELKGKAELTIPADQSIAIVDLGYNHLNVVLMANGVYQFNRYIPQGASSIDRNLMSFFDFSEEEIEQKKRLIDLSISPSVADAVSTEMSEEALREANIVKNIVDNWINELERVFKYFISRNRGRAVQKILIHGGTAQMKGLDIYFSKVLGIPVECIQKLSSVEFQEVNKQNMTPFMNAIGAFIRR